MLVSGSVEVVPAAHSGRSATAAAASEDPADFLAVFAALAPTPRPPAPAVEVTTTGEDVADSAPEGTGEERGLAPPAEAAEPAATDAPAGGSTAPGISGTRIHAAAWQRGAGGCAPATPPPAPAVDDAPETPGMRPAMELGDESRTKTSVSGGSAALSAPPAEADAPAMAMPGPGGTAAPEGPPAAERDAGRRAGGALPGAEGLAAGSSPETAAPAGASVAGGGEAAPVMLPADDAPAMTGRPSAADGGAMGARIVERAAEQIAAAVRAGPDGRIELQLAPEELGPVRLELSPADGSITVELVAERGETLDLLRRHADMLARELRQAGYGEVRFQFGRGAFGDGTAPHHSHAPAGGEGGRGDATATGDAPPGAAHNLSRALDLRL